VCAWRSMPDTEDPAPDEVRQQGQLAPKDGGPRDWLLRQMSKLARHASAHSVLILTIGIGAVLVVGLTAASASVYDAVAEKDGVSGLDGPVLNQAMSWRTPLSARLITWFTHLGGPTGMTILVTGITLAMLWRWRSVTPLILMVCAAAGSLTFTTVGKAVVGRRRPPLADAIPPYEYAFSFPSGHTLNSTVIAGMVAYLVAIGLKSHVARVLCAVAAALWALAMGASRVFLGHHWFTDVIFAWLLGLAWLALLITAHRVYLTVRRLRARAADARSAIDSG
jgi:membrane-associated phospholipid phosphatase